MTKKEFRQAITAALIDVYRRAPIGIDAFDLKVIRLLALLEGCDCASEDQLKRDYTRNSANITRAQLLAALSGLLVCDLVRIESGCWALEPCEWPTARVELPNGEYTVVGSPAGFAAWIKVADRKAVMAAIG